MKKLFLSFILFLFISSFVYGKQNSSDYMFNPAKIDLSELQEYLHNELVLKRGERLLFNNIIKDINEENYDSKNFIKLKNTYPEIYVDFLNKKEDKPLIHSMINPVEDKVKFFQEELDSLKIEIPFNLKNIYADMYPDIRKYNIERFRFDYYNDNYNKGWQYFMAGDYSTAEYMFRQTSGFTSEKREVSSFMCALSHIMGETKEIDRYLKIYNDAYLEKPSVFYRNFGYYLNAIYHFKVKKDYVKSKQFLDIIYQSGDREFKEIINFYYGVIEYNKGNYEQALNQFAYCLLNQKSYSETINLLFLINDYYEKNQSIESLLNFSLTNQPEIEIGNIYKHIFEGILYFSNEEFYDSLNSFYNIEPVTKGELKSISNYFIALNNVFFNNLTEIDTALYKIDKNSKVRKFSEYIFGLFHFLRNVNDTSANSFLAFLNDEANSEYTQVLKWAEFRRAYSLMHQGKYISTIKNSIELFKQLREKYINQTVGELSAAYILKCIVKYNDYVDITIEMAKEAADFYKSNYNDSELCFVADSSVAYMYYVKKDYKNAEIYFIELMNNYKEIKVELDTRFLLIDIYRKTENYENLALNIEIYLEKSGENIKNQFIYC